MSEKFQKLITLISRLPGIGQRQATRLVLAMLDWPDQQLAALAQSIQTLKVGPTFCQQCFNFADEEFCTICKNPRRNQFKIAVVERVPDLVSMERTSAHDGVYHVLGGAINPVDGLTPDKLRIHELITRVKRLKALSDEEYDPTRQPEVILATSPNTFGDTTALYLFENLKSLGVPLTRLARGLASGSSIEYTDEATLAHALKNRK